MIFNSLEYFLFLPIVFVLFWFVCKKSIRWQNVLLIFASYFFYGWWDWRFLGLIILSSILDYTLGVQIDSSDNEKKRKGLLWVSILVNLGILGFFKYFNFFVDSTETMLNNLGMQADFFTLNILLPVGISFYTFQTLSYTIDVYRREIKASRDPLAFFAYVAFFPQLVAGPIERAKNFIPQFSKEKTFDYEEASDGLRQMLWGFFKKVVIADSCSPFVDQIFADPSASSSPVLMIGAVLFAFQIYGDFSGYTDIALGTARLFGFNLMRNFAYPYFSRDIAEFWRRWHISLSSWFKDYLYFPLGGSRGSQALKVRNTFAIFLVSGFWHGANWTFIFWGGLNALYFLPSLLMKTNRKNIGIVAADRMLPSFREFYQIITTFFLTCIAWIFFRATSITHGFNYIIEMFSFKSLAILSNLKMLKLKANDLYTLFFFIVVLIIIEWIQRKYQHGLERMNFAAPLRWLVYFILAIVIMYHIGEKSEFIYFQF